MKRKTAMTNIEVKILDQILLVDLSAIRLWTARKKLKPEMLEGKIPPATLASLGSMRVIDPEELKPFERLKRRATALVESRGVKFLGGYAIPDSLIHEIVDELNTLKAEFYQAKADFISRYDSLVDAWVNQAWEKNEWREAIRSSVTPKAVVEHSLQFGFAACRVAPDKDDKLNNLLNGEVRGLADQLYADTAAEAEDLLSTGLAGRGHVDQRTLNTLRRMNAKLRGLMFLSSDVRALTEYITELLDTLPTAGVVNGSQYAQVVTLVSALSTEAGIKNLVVHLNTSNGKTDTDEELQSVVTVSAPAQTMVTSEPDVEVEAEAALPAAEQPVEQVEEEVGVVDTPIEPETAPAPAGQVVEFPSIQDLIEREQRQQTARRRNAFYF
jgi:hypothetical protein